MNGRLVLLRRRKLIGATHGLSEGCRGYRIDSTKDLSRDANQAWPLRRPAEAPRQTGGIGEPSSSLVLFTKFVQDAHAIELLQELRCNCDGSAEAPFERPVQFCGAIHPFRWSPCK